MTGKNISEYHKTVREFEQSVKQLSSLLPQWNSDDNKRVVESSIYSLLEEAGEICGLISKYRIRKNYWQVLPDTLKDYEDIRQKFINESSDFLWVLVCSYQHLCTITGHRNLFLSFCDYYFRNLSFDQYYKSNDFICSITDIIDNILKLQIDKEQQSMLQKINYIDKRVIYKDFKVLFKSFYKYLITLKNEYDINLVELCEYNMKKLEKRYDKDGNRKD